MTRASPPPSVAVETGKTAGVFAARTPGAFFRRIKRAGRAIVELHKPAATGKSEAILHSLFPDQAWLVTHRRPNGEVLTQSVLINGGIPMIDLETMARIALKRQRDVDCGTILRICLDCRHRP
jgi:hypothetical protein